MFRRRRRGGWRRFVVVGVALACVPALAGWWFEWFPIRIVPPESGTRVALPDTEPAFEWREIANPPADVVSDTPDGTAQASGDEAFLFEGQTEPDPVAVEDSAFRPRTAGALPRSRLREVPAWRDPQPPAMPDRFPARDAVASSAAHGKREQPVSGVAHQSAVVADGAADRLPPSVSAPERASSPSASRGEIRQTAGESSEPIAQPTPDELLARADAFIDSGDYAAAHKILSRLYWQRPDLRGRFRKRIETTARSIFFDPQPHYMEPYVVQPGDQLRVIARQYDITWEYLARLNRIDPRRIRPGQKLKVIRGPFSAVVDLSDFELTVHVRGYFVCRFPVGIGKDGSTPVGRFQVLNKVVNPQYTDPEGRVVDADDPSNPLGERWLDLGDGYGIHGTIEPDSIGTAASRGCIRLRNDDVEIVYDLLTVGSEVRIVR